MKPKNDIFQKLGEQLSQQGVTVDMFITTEVNIELATISPLAVLTSGNIYYYQNFNIKQNQDQLYYDVFRCLNIQRGFDVVCKLRCSTFIQINEHLTPKGKENNVDFKLPSLS